MKSRAAVLTGPHRPFEIVEIDVDDPGPGEVMIRYVASGLCHSDLHLIEGDLIGSFPMVGGHEGAGIVERVGPGVTRVTEGDHVVCSFVPSCGRCRYCATGRQNICDLSAHLLAGVIPGSANPQYDIPRLLALHEEGKLMLDELITTRYRLDDINEGYADMVAGKNIRGLVVHDT